jgi:hypothetical protein
VLVRQRASLAESIDVFPLAASNLLNAYDPRTRTLDGRADLNELSLGPAAQNQSSQPILPLPVAEPMFGGGR